MSGEILLVSGNPSRRRKRKGSRARRRRGSTARRRRSTSRRRHTARRKSFRVRRVRARRNPVALSVGGVLGNVKAGAIGALGGLANDLAFGYVKGYLPAQVQSGFGASAVKLLTAVGIGWVGNKVMRGKGRDFAVGAATVVLHELGKQQLAQMMPTLPLGEYMDMTPALPNLSGYNPGEIVDGVSDDDGVGEYILSDYNDDTF